MSNPTPEHDRPATPICSARDCHSDAVWDLLWNNPKLHTSDRRKSWLACEEHRESLSSFLAARQFLREVRPLGDPPGDPAGDSGDRL